jgi:hypothetical protein
MNPLIRLKTIIRPLLTAFVLACLELLPKAQAVFPPPDGGYPGGNTAEGQNALLSLTSGMYNTAVGIVSLGIDTDAGFNTAIGAGALLLNNADNNTATGAFALLSNTTGPDNTAIGALALFSNTEGNNNTAIGADAMSSNTTGIANTASGVAALRHNIDGDFNSAFGVENLYNNSEGRFNTAIGGYRALDRNTTGDNNTGVGSFALFNNQTGNLNTAIGSEAGEDITGSGNVCIGEGVLGDAGVNNTTWIRNVNTTVQSFSAGVNNYVTVRLADGRLGHTQVVSSRRYKEDIKPLAAVSEVLYALKPVSFRLKKEYDGAQSLGFGLIAEEVEKVDPALVYRNGKGQVESVRYDMVNAMLLNEFLKEHRKVENLEAIVVEQQKQIRALTAGLEKVSAQLEMKGPLRVVENTY